jgi:hypothetical protein
VRDRPPLAPAVIAAIAALIVVGLWLLALVLAER